jgi:hypothetical protein
MSKFEKVDMHDDLREVELSSRLFVVETVAVLVESKREDAGSVVLVPVPPESQCVIGIVGLETTRAGGTKVSLGGTGSQGRYRRVGSTHTAKTATTRFQRKTAKINAADK